MPTKTIEQAIQLAVEHHSGGRLQEAESLYRQILAVAPNHADVLHLLGVLAGQVGQHQAGSELIRRAIAVVPDQPTYHSNLGNLLHHLGRSDEAIACYQRAMELKPDFAEAHHNLGVVWRSQGRMEDAIACFRRAVELKGDYVEAHDNLGNALLSKGQLDEAIACYRRALEVKPDRAQTHNNLGNALEDSNRSDEAMACFRRALELKPDFADAHYNLGNAWKAKGRLDEAIACYRRALQFSPRHAEAHCNLGNALKDEGQLDEAICCFRQAMAIKSDSRLVHDGLLFTLQYQAAADAQSIFEEACRWNERYAQPLKQVIRPHFNDRSPHRRLKIGYVSPNFRDHAVGRFLMPLFREHDHASFEVICYPQVPFPDAITDRFRACADQWRSIVGLCDQQVAELIRQDGIDILVDLTLHMTDNRLLVFARKPAPVQVTFAGYPGTTGLKTIDYRLTDPYLDPPGLFDRYYSETVFRLPHSFWCFDPLGSQTTVNPLPALDAGRVTFGCLNNFCKINEAVLRLWGQVLGAVENSRLLLLSIEGSHRQRAIEILRSQGIAAERVEFATRRRRAAYAEYLEFYHGVDIGLDTLPYTGHNTSLDSFWMGVPVITLVGRTVVGRAGLCQLMNLGLGELVAHTPEQFVQVASELARDLPRLKTLRSTLRQRMESSPLMDARGYARGIEAAYRTMWQTWCEQA